MEQRHIHILGICGTFMGGLAMIARELIKLLVQMSMFIRR